MWYAFFRPASRLSCVAGKFNVGRYTQTSQPVFFINLMLVGTIGLCHCIPIPVALTLDGINRSAYSKDRWCHFLSYFIWSEWNVMWCWRSSWISWYYFWKRSVESKEITVANCCTKQHHHQTDKQTLMLTCFRTVMSRFQTSYYDRYD